MQISNKQVSFGKMSGHYFDKTGIKVPFTDSRNNLVLTVNGSNGNSDDHQLELKQDLKGMYQLSKDFPYNYIIRKTPFDPAKGICITGANNNSVIDLSQAGNTKVTMESLTDTDLKLGDNRCLRINHCGQSMEYKTE